MNLISYKSNFQVIGYKPEFEKLIFWTKYSGVNLKKSLSFSGSNLDKDGNKNDSLTARNRMRVI